MIESIWNLIRELLENPECIIDMAIRNKEIIISDKDIKYFDKESLNVSKDDFMEIANNSIDKVNKSYISDIYNRVKNNLFVYYLKDEYSPNVLSLELISFMCEEYEKCFPYLGLLDICTIKTIYESEQKIKALEDLVLNLILVNNEYKRQIEGL